MAFGLKARSCHPLIILNSFKKRNAQNILSDDFTDIAHRIQK